MFSPLAKTNVFVIITAIALMFSTVVSAEEKSDSLQHLQELRKQNVKRLQEIDETLRRAMDESGGANLEKTVEQLKLVKNEHVLREDLLNRLIFQIDTKFAGGDLRAFLEPALLEMAKVDATNSTNDSGLWKFMKFCSEAIRKLPERKENVLAFVEGYMNRSVSHPITPDEYLAQRNYSNGATSDSGLPMTRDQAGEIADRRLQEAKAAPINASQAIVPLQTEAAETRAPQSIGSNRPVRLSRVR